jgi:hypothetical protein
LRPVTSDQLLREVPTCAASPVKAHKKELFIQRTRLLLLLLFIEIAAEFDRIRVEMNETGRSFFIGTRHAGENETGAMNG